MLISLGLITRKSSDYSMSTQQKTMSSLLNNYRSCSHSYYIGGPINTGITTTYNPHLTMGLLCNSKRLSFGHGCKLHIKKSVKSYESKTTRTFLGGNHF